MLKAVIRKSLICITIVIPAFNNAYSQTDTAALEMLSLKELLDVKVTAASKTPEELEKAPATVVVITEEQIQIPCYQSLLDVMYDLPDMKVDDKIYSGIRNTFTLRGTVMYVYYLPKYIIWPGHVAIFHFKEAKR